MEDRSKRTLHNNTNRSLKLKIDREGIRGLQLQLHGSIYTTGSSEAPAPSPPVRCVLQGRGVKQAAAAAAR